MKKGDSLLMQLVLLVWLLLCWGISGTGRLLKWLGELALQTHLAYKYRQTPFYLLDKAEGMLTGKLSQLISEQKQLRDEKKKLEQHFERICRPSQQAEQAFVNRIALIEEALTSYADEYREREEQLLLVRNEREELRFFCVIQETPQPEVINTLEENDISSLLYDEAELIH